MGVQAPGAREEAEFTDFVSASRGPLMHTAYLLTGSRSAAEDLLQDALVKVYLAWSRIEPGLAWAYTRRVMVNLSTDRWRRRRYEPVLTDRPEAHTPPVGLADYAAIEARSEIVEQLAKLNPRERVAVVLRYYHDLSEAETANLMGVSVGTVKSTCSRALARLRRTVEPVR